MIYIDSMHGKLARILRVFGVSCIYIDPSLDDNQILKMLNKDDLLITSDRELSIRWHNSIYLEHKDVAKNIEKLVDLGIKLDIDNPYCYRCNIKLEKIYEKYYCNKCGKYYWRGKQWNNLKKYLPRKIFQFRDSQYSL